MIAATLSYCCKQPCMACFLMACQVRQVMIARRSSKCVIGQLVEWKKPLEIHAQAQVRGVDPVEGKR